MAESTGSTKGAKKGGQGKLTSGQKAALAVGGAVVVYFLYRYYQNSQASTASTSTTPSSQIDPLTGQPYTAGVGSLAPGASSTSSTGQAIDPATGQPYATELSNAQQTISNDTGTITGLDAQVSQLLGIASGGGATTPGSSGSGSGSTVSLGGGVLNEGQMLKAWREAATAHLVSLGLTPAQAGQQVALYIEGKHLTNATAVRGITQIATSSPPPLPKDVTVLPLPTLAKSATQHPVAPSHAASTGPAHSAAPTHGRPVKDPIRPPSTASTQPRPAPHPSGNRGQAAPAGHAPTIAVPHQAAVG